MLIVFIGPPGAGKGTQAERLLKHLGIPHLSTGALLREARSKDSPLGKAAAEYTDKGRLVPDGVVIKMVEEELNKPAYRRGCLFDGFPRTLDQARALDELLARQGSAVDLVLELRADEAVLVARMLKRAIEQNRTDDNQATIAERMAVYRNQTSPLLRYYGEQGKLASIDALGSPDEVFGQIRTQVDECRQQNSAPAP